MSSGLIIGIDQGSTGSKAIAVDRGGVVMASAYSGIRTDYPRDGWVEHDAGDIWRSVKACLADLKRLVDFSRVEAIGITNQRETCVIWDRTTGEPLTPAISWQCTRSQQIVGEWEPLREEILAKTGLGLNAYYSASKVKWLFDKDEGLRRRCEDGSCAFGTIDAWLIWNLTGGRSHRTDPSNAGRTMFFDIGKLRWDEDLLGRMGLPAAMLGEVLPSDGEFGLAVSPPEIFDRPVPIRACLGDQQSAVFGQACFEEGEAKCTIGTCLNLGFNAGGRVPRGGVVAPSVGWDRSGKVTYNLEGGVFVGGSLFSWLQGQMGLVGSFSELESSAAGVGSSEGLFFVPAFTGLGSPYWDGSARGTIVGMSFNHTKAHLLRSAVESIAFQACDVLCAAERDYGFRIGELRVDGGVSKSDFVLQVFADITDRVVRRPENIDRTPMGAVFMAGLSCGFWRGLDELRGLWRLDREFRPRLEASRRDDLLSGWREAVERARGWTEGRRVSNRGE